MQLDVDFEEDQLQLRYRLLDEVDQLERLIDWVMFRRRVAESKNREDTVVSMEGRNDSR